MLLMWKLSPVWACGFLVYLIRRSQVSLTVSSMDLPLLAPPEPEAPFPMAGFFLLWLSLIGWSMHDEEGVEALGHALMGVGGVDGTSLRLIQLDLAMLVNFSSKSG